MLLESQEQPKLETSTRRRPQVDRLMRAGSRLSAHKAPALGHAWRAADPNPKLPKASAGLSVGGAVCAGVGGLVAAAVASWHTLPASQGRWGRAEAWLQCY